MLGQREGSRRVALYLLMGQAVHTWDSAQLWSFPIAKNSNDS